MRNHVRERKEGMEVGATNAANECKTVFTGSQTPKVISLKKEEREMETAHRHLRFYYY